MDPATINNSSSNETQNNNNASDNSGVSKANNSDSLKAFIRQISNKGLITLVFTQDIMVLSNVSAIDYSALSINFTDIEDAQKLKFTWKTVSMTKRTIEI